jgi:hypothetical protein
MRISGEGQRQGADAGALQAVRGHQTRLGKVLVQPLNDGERLGQHTAVVQHQRGH